MNTIIQLWPLWLTLIVLAGILAWKRLGKPDTYSREDVAGARTRLGLSASLAPDPVEANRFFAEQRRIAWYRAEIARIQAVIAIRQRRKEKGKPYGDLNRQVVRLRAELEVLESQREGIAA